MSSRKGARGKAGGAMGKNDGGKKKAPESKLGQKLTSGATTAEDNSTLAGIEKAYGITLEDVRLKAELVLETLKEELKESKVMPFTEETEITFKRLYEPATDQDQHAIDETEEQLQFAFQSQLDLQAFVDRVTNFITKTPSVFQPTYYRPLLQLYEACYRHGLARLDLTVKRAELIGAKERPHLHAILMDEKHFLEGNNRGLFEKFTSSRMLWQMQSGRWNDIPSRQMMANDVTLGKKPSFDKTHLGLLTDAAREGSEEKCEKLIADGRGHVNEVDQKTGVSPIHHAAWEGHLDVVMLLLEKKAEIDAQTKRGYTALHFATERQHESVVSLLIASGASETIQSLLGQKPADMEKIHEAKDVLRRKKNLQKAMAEAMAEQKEEARLEKLAQKKAARALAKGNKKGKKKK